MTNDNLTRARNLLAEAEKMVAAARAEVAKAEGPVFPKEPDMGARYNGATVMTFKKQFGRSNNTGYTYAAIRPGYLSTWFVTGRGQESDPINGMSWLKLCEFIAKDEGENLATVIKTMRVWSSGAYLVDL